MSTRGCWVVCDCSLPVPGWVRTDAGEGPGSRLDRRSIRVAGLALRPVPIGAESSRRERVWGLWVAVFSNRPLWT